MPEPNSDDGGEPVADWAERIDDDLTPEMDGRDDAGRESPEGIADAVEAVESPPEEPEQTVLADLRAYFEGFESEFAPAPDEDFLESSFFDFGYREEYEETDRYWVNEPFAYIAVLYDATTNDYRYHVVEPTLSEFERYVREDIMADLLAVIPTVRRVSKTN